MNIKKRHLVYLKPCSIKIKNETILILINLSVVKQNEEKNKDTDQRKIDPKLIGKKIGRNELCYCGSNKKFKHCCGSL